MFGRSKLMIAAETAATKGMPRTIRLLLGENDEQIQEAGSFAGRPEFGMPVRPEVLRVSLIRHIGPQTIVG